MSMAAIIYIILVIIGLIAGLMMHGKRTEHNFFETVIGTIITVGLLTWGGFFDQVEPETPHVCPTAQVVVPDGYELVPVGE